MLCGINTRLLTDKQAINPPTLYDLVVSVLKKRERAIGQTSILVCDCDTPSSLYLSLSTRTRTKSPPNAIPGIFVVRTLEGGRG